MFRRRFVVKPLLNGLEFEIPSCFLGVHKISQPGSYQAGVRNPLPHHPNAESGGIFPGNSAGGDGAWNFLKKERLPELKEGGADFPVLAKFFLFLENPLRAGEMALLGILVGREDSGVWAAGGMMWNGCGNGLML